MPASDGDAVGAPSAVLSARMELLAWPSAGDAQRPRTLLWLLDDRNVAETVRLGRGRERLDTLHCCVPLPSDEGQQRVGCGSSRFRSPCQKPVVRGRLPNSGRSRTPATGHFRSSTHHE